ncbi:ATP-grasp domain-containing protein [Amycolatopsis sp. NPDC059657]|uniref:ATP-grasp domain-containing protein n=1 Tax=Amycolatopsis sp. NPDC059657 TaxID=3346899 RepID=UPI003671336C
MTGNWRVVVVGGKAKNLESAWRQGYEVVHLQHPAQFTDQHRDASAAALLLDYTDLDLIVPVLRALHAVKPIDQIIAMTEHALVPAARMREALGVPGVSARASAMLRDKLAMRRSLQHEPALIVRHAEVTDEAGCRAFGERGYPIMLKPIDGVGSRQIFRIDDVTELPAAVASLRESGCERFLAEQFVEGREFSVESLSLGGEHRLVAITEKFLGANGVEAGHVVPARLTPAEDAAIRGLVLRFLDVIGLTDGLGHTEVILGEDGPVIVESHDRVGGDRITDLVAGAYGVHLVEAAFAVASGDRPLPPEEVPAGRAMAILFLTPPAGRLVSVSGVDEARLRAGVREAEFTREPGDLLPELRSSDDRSGFVIVVAEDADRALALARDAVADIRIEVESEA